MTVEEISPAIVRRFLDQLEHDRHCGGATRNLRLSSISQVARGLGQVRGDHPDSEHDDSGCLHHSGAAGFNDGVRRAGRVPVVAAPTKSAARDSVVISSGGMRIELTGAGVAYPARPVGRQAARLARSHERSAKAYARHYRDVVQRQAGKVTDRSRVDAMIAVRMRATGHTQQQVESALRLCAPMMHPNTETRGWSNYAQRTAVYAFGAPRYGLIHRAHEFNWSPVTQRKRVDWICPPTPVRRSPWRPNRAVAVAAHSAHA